MPGYTTHCFPGGVQRRTCDDCGAAAPPGLPHCCPGPAPAPRPFGLASAARLALLLLARALLRRAR